MMRLPLLLAFATSITLFLAGCGAKEEPAARAPAQVPDDQSAATVDFVVDVRPTLETYCLPCHGGKGQKGITLDALATNEAAATSGAVLREMAEEIEEGKMPPKTAKAIPDDVKAKLVADLKTLGG